MPIRPRATAATFARRILGRVVLVGALLTTIVGAAGPVGAGQYDSPDYDEPVARLQVIIKKVIVHDDKDWGEGDIQIFGWFTRIDERCPADSRDDDCMTQLLKIGLIQFGADDGETKVLDRTIPSAADGLDDESVTTSFGIPIYARPAYRLSIVGREEDAFISDFLGRVDRVMTAQDGWGMGTHTERSVLDASGRGDGERGHFSVEYEIRPVPLPDLRPVNIKVLDAPGSADKLVCMGVQNIGSLEAGPFEVALHVDGVVPPNGKATAGRLGSGQYGELCVQTALPRSGQHQLAAVADEPRGLFEQNETNNRFEQPYAAARTVADAGARADVATEGATIEEAAAPAPVAAPSPSADVSARPAGPLRPEVVKPGIVEIPPTDLQVGDVKVEARGGGRCVIRGVRNTVTVAIKNPGGQSSGEVAVEVRVGGQERGKRTVPDVAAAGERTVEIRDVGVAQGEGAIEVIVDPDNKVAEGDEKNNAKTVPVDCVAG